ncbi:hypothetical protein BDP27DRAFT_1426222 [Rhodocollybia butyracea]|uniref:Hydrophobin n=1 Tax=Rhodocollybia butyracea TaxID=206335 RepID=A0A9P5PF30_9AGAR|nr:hypothetical protein BDP27DRAFT_1426222 [Rhodocollybia butyracea]
MQFKHTFVAAALATLVVASPTPRSSSATCASPIQCCNSVQTPTQAAADGTTVRLLALIGVSPVELADNEPSQLIGLDCFAGASPCDAPALEYCCVANALTGLISTGCTLST